MKKNKIKVVMITSLWPYSNYSRFLCENLNKKKIDLTVYAEKKLQNKKIKNCGNVKLILDSSPNIFINIFKELIKDKPDILHIQYELNMYGGLINNIILPIFLLFLRFLNFKILITIHAVVAKNLINRDFVKLFKGDRAIIPPTTLKLYFLYSYYLIGLSAQKIIVHTNLLKKILSHDYYIDLKKINVIPMGVPYMLDKYKSVLGNYFLYFGYIARRKGLENMLNGYKKYIDNPKIKKKLKLFLSGGVIKGQEFAKEELQRLIRELKLQKYVKFLGFLSTKKIHEYHAKAYCCLTPAIITISASGPLSMMFGHGKCVISSKIGNFCEEIDHKIDGYLVDNDMWHEAFTYVSRNKNFIKKVEKNVIKKAMYRSWYNTANRNIKIYEKII